MKKSRNFTDYFCESFELIDWAFTQFCAESLGGLKKCDNQNNQGGVPLVVLIKLSIFGDQKPTKEGHPELYEAIKRVTDASQITL